MGLWLALWLASDHVGNVFAPSTPTRARAQTGEQFASYPRDGAKPGSVLPRSLEKLPTRGVQMMDLSAGWASIFLPHILQKICRVTFRGATDITSHMAIFMLANRAARSLVVSA